MAYSMYDFSESLDRVGISPGDIEAVTAAWGDQGALAEWTGGFVFRLKDGRWAYLSGWCDTTGWGCQDGADVKWFESEPDVAAIVKSEWDKTVPEWDRDPADLNRFIRGEIDKFFDGGSV